MKISTCSFCTVYVVLIHGESVDLNKNTLIHHIIFYEVDKQAKWRVQKTKYSRDTAIRLSVKNKKIVVTGEINV